MAADKKVAMTALSSFLCACGSCGQPIRWGKTASGASMPCQPNAVVINGEILSSETHWPHCPSRAQHKKAKP